MRNYWYNKNDRRRLL